MARSTVTKSRSNVSKSIHLPKGDVADKGIIREHELGHGLWEFHVEN